MTRQVSEVLPPETTHQKRIFCTRGRQCPRIRPTDSRSKNRLAAISQNQKFYRWRGETLGKNLLSENHKALCNLYLNVPMRVSRHLRESSNNALLLKLICSNCFWSVVNRSRQRLCTGSSVIMVESPFRAAAFTL